jgi:hypothetical protein
MPDQQRTSRNVRTLEVEKTISSNALVCDRIRPCSYAPKPHPVHRISSDQANVVDDFLTQSNPRIRFVSEPHDFLRA